MKFHFKELRVYQDAKEYCGYSRAIVNQRIRLQDTGLAEQIARASNSVVLNIPEGSADLSDAEFARFLTMAIRSVYETVAGFDLAALNGYIDEPLNQEIEDKAYDLVKQLAAFRNKLKAQPMG